METPASSHRRIRTGLFDIDFGSGEVHKDGRKVQLQEQPFRVLEILLERPGEVVTREQLQERLWSADTYVGFDEGLNTAIRKLRVAFGDSAENPRFIETVSRRGYRFIAPVKPGLISSPSAPSAIIAARKHRSHFSQNPLDRSCCRCLRGLRTDAFLTNRGTPQTTPWEDHACRSSSGKLHRRLPTGLFGGRSHRGNHCAIGEPRPATSRGDCSHVVDALQTHTEERCANF